MNFNVFYFGFIFGLFLIYIHRNHLRNWNSTKLEDKLLTLVAIMVTVLSGILSLLLLFGAFD
jgi:hypothetical protein